MIRAILTESTEEQVIGRAPPPVTPIEKAMRRWPMREAPRRAEAPRPPFEGHDHGLGERHA